MRTRLVLMISVVTLWGLVAACAPQATAVPTKPQAAPPATQAAPAQSAPTTAPTAVKPASAAAADPAPAAKPKRGGTIVHSRTKDTDSWDPAVVSSSEHMVQIPLFENLLRYNLLDESTGKSEFQGQLADSWEVPDPSTVVLKLRKGVKFHDGTDFNAEAAKWSLERSMSHPKSSGKGFHEIYVPKVEVIDPFTIKMQLKEPSGLILANLTHAPGTPMANWSGIVSKVAVEKYGDDFASHATGTGPIMMVEWKRDQQTVFKKFDGYWGMGADGKSLPYYDGITSRVTPDSAALLAELKAGTVHITDNVDPPNWPGIKSNPELVLRLTPWHPLLYRFGLNQESPLFKDNKKLRQALAYSVDRKGIANAIGPGFNNPGYYDPWVPLYVGWDESLPRYEYDEAKAKQLMTEAGLAGGLDVRMIAFPQSMYLRPAEMVAGAFGKIRVRVKMDVMDDVTSRGKLQAHDFDVHTWYSMPSLDPGHLTKSIACQGSANHSQYCNPEMDKCMAEGNKLFDTKQRAEIYKRCQQIFHEDALVVGYMTQPKAVVHRAELKGVRLQTSMMDLWEAWLDK